MPAHPLLKSSSCYTIASPAEIFGRLNFDPLDRYETLAARFNQAKKEEERYAGIALASSKSFKTVLARRTAKYRTCKSFILASNLIAMDKGEETLNHHDIIECHEFFIPALQSRLSNVVDMDGQPRKWAAARDMIREDCMSQGKYFGRKYMDAVSRGHRTLEENCQAVVESCARLFPEVTLEVRNDYIPGNGKKQKIQVVQPDLFGL